LIIDEAESILAQIESLQMNDYYSIFVRLMVFDDLIKHSAKVIAMDSSYAEYCTYDLLASSCKHALVAVLSSHVLLRSLVISHQDGYPDARPCQKCIYS